MLLNGEEDEANVKLPVALTRVFVKFVPGPAFGRFAKLSTFPFGALMFIIKSATSGCVTLNVTVMFLIMAPAGIPDTAILFVTPAVLKFGIARFTFPEANSVVTVLETLKLSITPSQTLTLAGINTVAGAGCTTCVLLDAIGVHPPTVVKVNVAVPLYPNGGVQVAFRSLAEGLKVPAASLLHKPPVALVTLPPRGAVAVLPQIAVSGAPGFDVGKVANVSIAPAEVIFPLLLLAIAR